MDLKGLLVEKDLFDSYGINYLYSEDIDVCDFVITQLEGINENSGKYDGKEIFLDELKEKSLSEISILGNDVYTRVLEKINTVSIQMLGEDSFQFGTGVSYIVLKDGTILSDTGRVDRYIIPKKLYEISSYGFAHEHIHALKEINYFEYVECKTFGEVLPLLFELIMYNPDDKLRVELIRRRMDAILNNGCDFLKINKIYNELNDSKDLFEKDLIDKKIKLFDFLRTKSGCYLNSFYYAIILYNIYKENPIKILNLMSKVLKCEMTTYSMLSELGIYGDIKGEVFKKELDGIKKILRR